MWLPTPVYKSLPTAYAFIGVVFILGVLYIGLDAPLGPVYLGVGILSILASITVTLWRGKHKSDRTKIDSDKSTTA